MTVVDKEVWDLSVRHEDIEISVGIDVCRGTAMVIPNDAVETGRENIAGIGRQQEIVGFTGERLPVISGGQNEYVGALVAVEVSRERLASM